MRGLFIALCMTAAIEVPAQGQVGTVAVDTVFVYDKTVVMDTVVISANGLYRFRWMLVTKKY